MKDFQFVIQNFLKDHEKHKKYLALLTVLSIVVSFAVPFSLIMPAVSMTNDSASFQNMYADNNLVLLGASSPLSEKDISVSENEFLRMYLEVDGHRIYTSYPDDSADTNYEIQGDTANLSFDLTYYFKGVKDNPVLDESGPHIVFNGGISGLKNVNFSVVNNEVIDEAYDKVLKAGTFAVSDNGTISITLTPEYIQYVKNKGGGDLLGNLDFSGEASRSEGENGDGKITFAGQEIEVKFKDKYPKITNKSAQINNNDGTITWTINIDNSSKIDLSSYTLTDTMLGSLAEGTSVTFNPEGVGERNGNKITFHNTSANASSITITYKTKIKNQQLQNGSAENTASMQKNDNTEASRSQSTGKVWFSNPVSVEKTGNADYKETNGTYGNKIEWTIKLKSEYGTSLDGYKIIDDNIQGDVTISPQGSLNNGVLSETGDAKEITITYWADATEGKNTNKVEVQYPDGTKITEKSEDVNYAKKPGIDNVTKTGKYNQDTHEIEWTVTINSNDNISLKGYEVTDDQFPGDLSGLNITECYYNGVWKASDSVMNLVNGKLTFIGDVDKVKFTYKTSVQLPENNNADQSEVTSVVSNSIGFGKDNQTSTKTVDVTVNSRNTLTKTLSGRTGQENVPSNAEIKETFHWTANITHDGAFNGKVYIDTPSVTGGNNATHTLKTDTIKVYAGKYNNNLSLVNTGYSISPSDGQFSISFESSFDDYNYVKIEYDTEATIPKNVGGYGEYIFSNSAGFNEITGIGGSATINKTNPSVDEKTSLNITKNWNNDTENNRPENVTFKVKYHTGDNIWKNVKKSGDNYLYEGDSGYDTASDLTVTVNSSQSWKATLSNLQKTKSKVNENGTQGTVTNYYYMIEEGTAVGNQWGYKFFLKVDNGIYVGDGDYANPNYNCSITNTFYKNIDLTAKKEWDGDTKDHSSDTVTVKLMYSTDNKANWYPVSKDGDNYVLKSSNTIPITAELSQSTNWQTTWNNLPSKIIEDNSIKGVDYKIVEIKFNDTEIAGNSGDKIIVNDGYYVIGYSDNGNTRTVKNTFTKTQNINIIANKVWDDGNYTNRPLGVIVELQQKASNETDWKKYGEQTTILNSNNNWQCSWDNVPNQSIDNGTVITYEYRVKEVGYVDSNGESVFISSDEFATSNDGCYKVSYEPYGGTISNNNTNVIITNTFKTIEKINITPQKQWADDTANDSTGKQFKLNNRPQSVTFALQQKIGNGDWTNVKGSLDNEGNLTIDNSENDVKVILSSAGVDNNSNGNEVWDGTQIKNLPKTQVVITNKEDGTKTYKNENCYYRFVEISYTDKNSQTHEIPSGDTSFQTADGDYKIENNASGINDTGTVAVKNKFTEDVGVKKYAFDRNGNIITSIEKQDLEDYKYTLSDGDYYIFNWYIKYDLRDWGASTDGNKLPTIKDHLPDGFTFVAEKEDVYGESGKKYEWGGTIADTSLKGDAWLTSSGANLEWLLSHYGKDYVAHPSIIWTAAGYAAAGVKAKSKEDIFEKYMYKISDTDIASDPNLWYYYDEANNDVYFNKYKATSEARIYYAIKIKCSDLDERLANGNYKIENIAYTYNDESANKANRTPTGDTIGSLEIKTPSNLITKNFSETNRPGYIQYSLDINPQGKNLSNGDTIDIEDIFKTVSYKDQHIETPYTGDKLIDVLMYRLKIYEIDANGNKTELSANDYILSFESGDKIGTDKSALLKLTIPDEKHIQIDYIYQLVANSDTPSVINGCKSSTKENGKYVTMRPGLIPPAGDTIVFSNKAKIISDNASEEASKENIQYKIQKSGGTISTNILPKIVKVDTGDYNIKNLSAQFLFAKYENNGWYYATAIDDKGAITWSTNATQGNVIADNAVKIDISSTKIQPVALERDTLYKLIEVKAPDGYEGSNLSLSDTEFANLITNYLESNITSDYADFLKNYISTYYFVYDSTQYSKPNEGESDNKNAFHSADVMQIKSGDDVEIPNNELIDITVSKEWWNNSGKEEDKASATIDVELYWSYTKSSTGIPEDAELVTKSDFGIIGDFENPKTIDASSDGVTAWSNIPNGKDNKPVYYYVKETGYKIDGTSYSLASNTTAYRPVYVGNAINKDGTVKIKNSQSLIIKKEWKNSNNLPLNPKTEEITVDIYGYDSNNSRTANPIISGIKLTKANNWIKAVSAINVDLSQYTKLEAVENPVMEGYTVSCVFNVNSVSSSSVGEIIVTNKNNNATDASVTVKKAWSDGTAVHANDSISVSLYRSTSRIDNIENLTENQLIGSGAILMTDPDDTDTVKKYTITLDSSNEWIYTWTGLPLTETSTNENGEEVETGNSYYYYVLEDMKNVANNDKYKATYTIDKQTSSKTDYTITNTRNSITVNKKWIDENGFEYAPDDVTADTIALRVYKKFNQKPDSLNIVAFGDSITFGETYNENGKSYATDEYLGSMLKSAEYGSYSNVSITKNKDTATDGIEIHRLQNQTLPDDTNVICIMLGTNNILHQAQYGAGKTYNNHSQDLEALIKALGNLDKENDLILLASIPNFKYADGLRVKTENWFSFLAYDESNNQRTDAQIEEIANNLVKNYNDYVQEVVQNLKDDNYNVIYVDVNKAINKDSDLYDGCHLNIDGVNNMAKAFASAINDYYAPRQYIHKKSGFTENVDEAKTYTVKKSDNWATVIDLPSGSENVYCVEEVNTRNSWTVTYEDNAQKAGSNTPIIIKNTYTPEVTSLTFEKTWVNDTNNEQDTAKRNKISLSLLRCAVDSNGNYINKDDQGHPVWEEYDVSENNVDLKTTGENNKIWTYTYSNLPAKDMSGNLYRYMIEEAPLNGYTPSNDGITNSVKAVVGGNAGTLKLTNTKTLNLTVKKIWSDGNDKHNANTVSVKVYRSTNSNANENANLMLVVTSDKNITLSQNDTSQISTNKTSGVTYESSNPGVATVDENGLITAVAEEGTAEITVKCGSETETINVTVSKHLSVSPNPVTIEGTKTVTLTVSNAVGNITITGGDSSIANIQRISNTQINITGVSSGNTAFTVSDTSDAPAVTVSVHVNPAFANTNSSLEVFEGDSLDLTFNKSGNITYSFNNNAISISGNTVTAKSVDSDITVPVTATLDSTGETATFDVKVKNFVITNSNLNIPLTRTLQLETNAPSGKTVTFEKVSGNEGITVSENGLVSLADTLTGGEKAVIKAKISDYIYYEVNIIAVKDDSTEEPTFELNNSEHSIKLKSNKKICEISYVIDSCVNIYNQDTVQIEMHSNSWNIQGSSVYNLSTRKIDFNSLGGITSARAENNKIVFTLDGTLNASELIFKIYNNKATISNCRITYVSDEIMQYALVPISNNVSDTAPSPQSETGNSGWISDGDKEYQLITITATDNWQKVLENLAVSDSSGDAYYYWVEEINANNSYEVSYKFEDGDDIGSDTDTAINALTPGDGVATIKNNYKESTGTAMPSTGGTGTQPYKVIGFAVAGGAVIMLGIRRRKKHC